MDIVQTITNFLNSASSWFGGNIGAGAGNFIKAILNLVIAILLFIIDILKWLIGKI